MNSEANCEMALRYFFAIKEIGRNTLSDKLDRPAYLQLFSEGVFKGPQYAYFFCLEFSCKGFLYNKRNFPQKTAWGLERKYPDQYQRIKAELKS